MAINFTFTQTANSHFAQVVGGGEKFLVGKDTVYKNTQRGLYNETPVPGSVYSSDDHENQFGFWAYFIAPTAEAESRNAMTCLNTYDRAKFTFGFMQYAAHVPNGDFVKFFKKLLELPEAQNYFPKLVLSNGRIFYRDSTGSLKQLESDSSSQGLMDYLNPTLNTIEDQELICSARFVHWALNEKSHRDIQVQVAISNFKAYMDRYSKAFNLNGYPANVCQVVCDIKHQGRATNPQIVTALNTGGNFEKAYSNLLQLGQPLYANRIATVKNAISRLTTVGKFSKTYDETSNEFV
jgi:hypothetical protein